MFSLFLALRPHPIMQLPHPTHRSAAAPPAEVGVLGLDARAAVVDADRGLVEGLSLSHVDDDLLHVPVDVGGRVLDADHAEHPGRLVNGGASSLASQ